MHKKLNKILIILLIITVGFTYIWSAPSTGPIGAITDFLHDLAMNNHTIYEVATVQFNGEYDNGNSGAAKTIDWDNGQYQKVTVSEATTLSFSNEFVGTITLRIIYGGAYAVAFNVADTILEEGGVELVFTSTNTAVDLLKVMNYGTADTYIVGVLLDVKD